MSGGLAGLLGFGTVILLIFVGVPVGIAMGAVGVIGMALLAPWSSVGFILGSAPFDAVSPYTLSIVPLFILMGVLASHGGLSAELYRAANALVGRWRGGLAMATVVACAIFGGPAGSSIATAATMCRVALPEMRRNGYDDRLSTATIAAGGTLGNLIPPSIIMSVYGLLTETSIGKLFLGALLPGFLAVALYMVAVRLTVAWRPHYAPVAHQLPLKRRARAVFEVWPIATLFIVVIGGIFVGWFSPTESAAVGCIGALIAGLLRRQLGVTALRLTIVETATTTGMIYLILIGATVFNAFLEMTYLPQVMVAQVQALGLGATEVVVLLIVFYLLLGIFMDSLSMVMLTVPVVFPLVHALGIDPIWFGVILVSVVEIGQISPPVGMNLFVIQTIGRVPQHVVNSGILPFIAADLVRLVLLIAFPVITLYLTRFMD